MLTEKTFDTGELVLNYAESDSAGAPMVLLHGLTSRWQHMVTPLAELQADWHIYAPDLRGHGKSGRAVDNAYDVGGYARDIIAFLKGVVKAPAVVIGHSLGALTTIGTAGGYPEGVRAAVLLDPPLYTALDPADIDITPNTKQYFQRVSELKSSSPSYETLLETARQAMPGADEEAVRDWADTLAGVAPGTVEAVLERRFWVDMELGKTLDKFTCPVLMIHGDWERDGAVRDSDVTYFKARMPDAQVVHMPGADHGLKMREQPELVVGYVKAFLQTV